MKKYFVFSDVHSFFDELITSLNDAGFDRSNPDHIVISCGDLLDRGDKTIECLEFINGLLDENRAICIRGNHEVLLNKVFDRRYLCGHDYHNGTEKTISALYEDVYGSESLKNATESEIIKGASQNEKLLKYLYSLRNYYETDKYVFVHGWIPCKVSQGLDDHDYYYKTNTNWRKLDERVWNDCMWYNPFEAWKQGVRDSKTIVCGHWSTSYAHANIHKKGFDDIQDLYFIASNEELQELVNWHQGFPTPSIYGKYIFNGTFKDKGIIGLDATTVITHKVNVETLCKGMKACAGNG